MLDVSTRFRFSVAAYIISHVCYRDQSPAKVTNHTRKKEGGGVLFLECLLVYAISIVKIPYLLNYGV